MQTDSTTTTEAFKRVWCYAGCRSEYAMSDLYRRAGVASIQENRCRPYTERSMYKTDKLSGQARIHGEDRRRHTLRQPKRLLLG